MSVLLKGAAEASAFKATCADMPVFIRGLRMHRLPDKMSMKRTKRANHCPQPVAPRTAEVTAARRLTTAKAALEASPDSGRDGRLTRPGYALTADQSPPRFLRT